MLDLVVKDGRAVGIVTRNLHTGEIESHSRPRRDPRHRRLRQRLLPLDQRQGVATPPPIWRAHKKGALFANPCFTQIHPTCIPASDEFQSKLTLMSESLRNDGRIWVPQEIDDARRADQIPEAERDYYLERRYPAFGNLVPRDVASRAAKLEVDEGRGVGPLKNGVYLDFGRPSSGSARDVIEERYDNLFEMYERITDEDPYEMPMRIYPAVHYTMGGLWVDYELQSTIPGCFVAGEANFSDHGANRLGASALMQGLADGYFVLPYTVPNYLAGHARRAGRAHRRPGVHRRPRPRSRDRTSTGSCRSAAPGRSTTSTASSARSCGTTAAWPAREASLEKALSEIPAAARRSSRRTSACSARADTLNQSLEKAGRVADFFELGRADVPRRPAPRGELRRPLPASSTRPRTARRCATTTTSPTSPPGSGPAPGTSPSLHKEPLEFEYVHLAPEELQVDATTLNLTLKIWRQAGPDDAGRAARPTTCRASATRCRSSRCSTSSTTGSPTQGEEPIAFEHDCREGICGSCGMMINGQAHGPQRGTATCQLHMRKFHDGDVITVEPWRAAAFPVVKDLVVNRSALDRIVEAGGYISVNTGAAPEANLIPVPKEAADAAIDAAACIGCGACVAACPNGAAQLFTSAKVAHLNLLPQGQPERYQRVEAHGRHDGGVLRLLHQPRRVPGGVPEGDLVDFIALMNRDYVKAKFKNRKLLGQRN